MDISFENLKLKGYVWKLFCNIDEFVFFCGV